MQYHKTTQDVSLYQREALSSYYGQPGYFDWMCTSGISPELLHFF